MTSSHFDLFGMEQDLSQMAASGSGSSNWMIAGNAASAAGLASLVHEARIAKRPGVVTRYHKGIVHGHSAPAHLILRSSYELNDAVVAVANSLVGKPAKKINDDIREKFGLLIRPLVPGSIEVDLVCPDPSDELVSSKNEPFNQLTADVGPVRTVTEEALERVLDVLSAIHGSTDRSELASRTADFPPTAWGKLVRMATRSVLGDFTIDFSDRLSEERFSFTPANAAFLKSYVETQELSYEFESYTGEWLTASKVRNDFDLRTEEDDKISGRVPEELSAEASKFYGDWVKITVKEFVQENSQTKRVLESIEEINPPQLSVEAEP